MKPSRRPLPGSTEDEADLCWRRREARTLTSFLGGGGGGGGGALALDASYSDRGLVRKEKKNI